MFLVGTFFSTTNSSIESDEIQIIGILSSSFYIKKTSFVYDKFIEQPRQINREEE